MDGEGISILCSWGQSTRKPLVSATALQEQGALENQEGSAQRCLWDVLSLPAPATCGSPFPSPLIHLQLPALLSAPVALSRDFPDHLGRSIPAFPRVARCLVLPCQNPGSQNTPTFQSNHFLPAPLSCQGPW